MDKLSHSQLAWRVAQDIHDGAYVNLGIGLPELVAQHPRPGHTIIFHSENGVLNFGEAPPENQRDWDLINAGKKPITINPGASFFDHAHSFAMVRGGHLDLAVLGAFQVACNGDLANWRTERNAVPAVGGAMDLVCGTKRVVVITEHLTKDGAPKLVEQCSFPLTGIRCVSRVYTNLAVIDVVESRFVLREKLPSMTIEDLQRRTGAPLELDGPVDDLVAPPD